MKVGDTVWLFDGNRRVYENGNTAPTFEKHFYQEVIDGETSRSWLIRRSKFSKKDPLGSGIYTDEQKADKIWERANRYKIMDKIHWCSIEKLKQIDNILGRL